ncbi:hypothetical protein F4009_14415 [Candidatus Poribacteria bacterium]|nr:hypothetical protein [Candidatus Poribacteria bacterium]MYH19499.1 hypothetical protein [Gemmatimonadota bacterium]MYK95168.1 hypothetical protein [Candidatus Poribacteria bacterium]
MLQSQKLKLELSKSRERLAALSAKEDATEAETTEMKELTDGYPALEERYRAAIVSENVEDPRDAAETGMDSEERELYALESKVEMKNYVRNALGQITLDGAEDEFKKAMGATDGQIPLAAILPRDDSSIATDEKYADTVSATTGTTLTRPKGWLDRLFAGEAASHLGISPMSVQPGEELYPLTSAGPVGGAVAKGVKRDAEAVTIDVSNKLSPVRCAASVHFHKQDVLRVPGFEQAIRRDLTAAIMNTMHGELINGADDASSNQLIEGLLESQTPKKIDGAADAALASASTGNDVIEGFEGLCDGIYARATSELKVLLAPEMRSYLGSLTDGSTNAPRGYVLDVLRTVKGIPIQATDHISELATTGDAKGDSYAIVSKARGLAGSYAFPVWSAADLVTDVWSDAQSGIVRLTLTAYYNFKVIRDANFAIRRLARS